MCIILYDFIALKFKFLLIHFINKKYFFRNIYFIFCYFLLHLYIFDNKKKTDLINSAGFCLCYSSCRQKNMIAAVFSGNISQYRRYSLKHSRSVQQYWSTVESLKGTRSHISRVAVRSRYITFRLTNFV